MPCPLCGDICRCSSDAHSAAPPRWLSDTDARPAVGTPPVALEPAQAHAGSRYPAAEGSLPSSEYRNESAPEDSSPWRQEVAARLNRYQARRKPRPPRYPSLRLRFDQEDPVRAVSGIDSQAFPQRIATASNQALALDGFADGGVLAVETPAPRQSVLSETQVPNDSAALPRVAESCQNQILATAAPTAPPTAQATTPSTAKIIEFPRSWTPP